MMDLKALNRERLERVREERSSGLDILISEIEQAQRWNRNMSKKRTVAVYFSWVTDNRLMAHIIVNHQMPFDDLLRYFYLDNVSSDTIFTQPRLVRLVIPEAGHRLYANYKDGYQANGGGYSKPFHILERMLSEVQKSLPIDSDWQSLVKCEVIA